MPWFSVAWRVGVQGVGVMVFSGELCPERVDSVLSTHVDTVYTLMAQLGALGDLLTA